ncbi:thiol-disulfide oxidoreductase DCC family protein [Longimicrobium sp.]|uniref:thiol-disulfide oxidoreductase DCC family protein n=1 Tax=Longimicrobium sp. TaxID=2029185 RepID=UPI002CC72D4B|nr:thiol-disulfide oxidoreductase DCC family protein [Longimicrobium sp.]HSU15293.1 thiol-disulfide oxidoreductase DCC family protein [Longimicrobium sp.]
MAEAEIAETGGPLVLYDGTCGLCSRSVQLILRHDRRGRFRFAALQSDAGRAVLARHGLPADRLDTVVLVDGGRAFTKSRAALRIARGMDAPWPALWPLALVPRAVADFCYDRVARNRYRLFGRTEACMLPPPEVRARFLS